MVYLQCIILGDPEIMRMYYPERQMGQDNHDDRVYIPLARLGAFSREHRPLPVSGKGVSDAFLQHLSLVYAINSSAQPHSYSCSTPALQTCSVASPLDCDGLRVLSLWIWPAYNPFKALYSAHAITRHYQISLLGKPLYCHRTLCDFACIWTKVMD